MKKFLKILIKTISSNTVKNTNTPKINKPTLEEVPNINTKNKESDDLNLLISLYKKNKISDDLNIKDFINKINPDATPNKCPYCNKINDFTASRARKCPDCNNKMVVRQGVFLTESQAKQVEEMTQEFYKKQWIFSQISWTIESAQNHKVNKDQVNFLYNLAEAFKFMAQVCNQKNEKGLSFWDKSWGYYNKARVEDIKSSSKSEYGFTYTKLPEISWAMAKAILDQANSYNNDEIIKKWKVKSLRQAMVALSEIAKYDNDSYYKTDIYKFIKEITNELNITSDELIKIKEDVSNSFKIEGSTLEKYNNIVSELINYEVIN